MERFYELLEGAEAGLVVAEESAGFQDPVVSKRSPKIGHPVPGGVAHFAAALRRELSERNRRWAVANGIPHQLTRGELPKVVYFPDGGSGHGNFLPRTYEAICGRAEWLRRLGKVHTTARMSLPKVERRWRELDCCHSSDALLMNVFCYPGVLSRGVLGVLGVAEAEMPCFGYRPRVPLKSGHGDRTEVDLKLGPLLIEAKLTEADFQQAPEARVMAYRDLEEVFRVECLPRSGETFRCYQLIRGTLAAHAGGGSFCVLCDARRPDLMEAWFAVMMAVVPLDLRLRLKLLTWQELSGVLPEELREFLNEKYGIC